MNYNYKESVKEFFPGDGVSRYLFVEQLSSSNVVNGLALSEVNKEIFFTG